MSLFESTSGSEGVLKAQTEPFPVLVSRAPSNNGTCPLNAAVTLRLARCACAALHTCCTEAQDKAVDGSNVHVCVAHV